MVITQGNYIGLDCRDSYRERNKFTESDVMVLFFKIASLGEQIVFSFFYHALLF